MTLASQPPTRLTIRRLAVVLGVLGSSSCAAALPDVGPADIPRLEQEVAADPANTDLQVQLGMAQFEAGNHETARTTLQTAVDAGNELGPALLYLGMASEELEDWTAARDAYDRYLTLGASAQAREQVRERLTLIGRNLLRARAQQALTQETQIAGAADVTPQSVAVLPLAFNSARADLEPLVFALSDMMTTDFAVSNALVVLERAQIQALLDEMALTTSGYAEATTGARAGRLLRAEHVFQGVLTTLGETDLQTDADVLNIPNTASAGQLTESAVLEQLFDMEKQIVIRTIREVLAVELTPAEEQAILENRMGNVLAFLAFGRGLRELDQGNYEAALAQFQESIALDPGSYASRDAAVVETTDLLAASAASTADLVEVASTTGEFGVGLIAPPEARTTQDLLPQVGRSTTPMVSLATATEAVAPSPSRSTLGLGTTEQTQSRTASDTGRDPVQESGGTETVAGGGGAVISIVIPRPGGAP
jgi:tetratricopeptide (TPR) repeat protein